mmetsp:Transcript_16724/g.56503  ORF Transcript_16724/g.56503 Transcript_16724/m.56503 type:complete len:250 (+) Transcript_16724:526-1275(+)
MERDAHGEEHGGRLGARDGEGHGLEDGVDRKCGEQNGRRPLGRPQRRRRRARDGRRGRGGQRRRRRHDSVHAPDEQVPGKGKHARQRRRVAGRLRHGKTFSSLGDHVPKRQRQKDAAGERRRDAQRSRRLGELLHAERDAPARRVEGTEQQRQAHLDGLERAARAEVDGQRRAAAEHPDCSREHFRLCAVERGAAVARRRRRAPEGERGPAGECEPVLGHLGRREGGEHIGASRNASPCRHERSLANLI